MCYGKYNHVKIKQKLLSIRCIYQTGDVLADYFVGAFVVGAGGNEGIAAAFLLVSSSRRKAACASIMPSFIPIFLASLRLLRK